MTTALLAVGLAALTWPGESRLDARVRQLRADQRLAAIASPTGGLRWRVHLAALAMRSISATGGPRGALVAGLMVGGALLAAQGPVAAAEFATCVFLMLWAAFSVARQTVHWRRRAARQVEVSLGVTLLASELEAGAAPAEAIRAAGAIGAELDAGAEVGVEAEPDVGVRNARSVVWSAREGDPMARVAAAWQVSARTGAPIVALLAGVRADLADRGDTDRAVATAVAGPQASAAVLALLPILGILLGSAIGGDPLAVLFATAAGRVLLCVGVALNAAGVTWTLALIARARR